MSFSGIYNSDTRERERGVNSQKGYDHTRFNNSSEYMKMVRAAATYFDRMRTLRKKIQRDTDYYMGRQLNDTVVYNGMTMTVHDYMEMKGLTPLSNDIINDKVVSMKGLIRNQYMAPKVKNVDVQEGDYALIFSELLRKNDNNNEMAEKSADLFEGHLVDGFQVAKVKWAYRDGREDVYVDIIDNRRIITPPFTSKTLEEVDFIAELYDVTWQEILLKFYRKEGDEERLAQIFTAATEYQPQQGYNDTGMDQTEQLDDFYHPSIVGRYRIVEIWRKEYNRALWCHDRLNASAGFRPLTDRQVIEAENERRRRDNIRRDENGVPMLDAQGKLTYYVPESELELIEYEPKIEELWYYRKISTNGYLLEEGISPYKVVRNGFSHYFHPYVFMAYGMKGEVRSFVDRIIDKQRQYNHDNILLDFIIMNSSKGSLAIDEEALTDSMGLEDIAENYVKVDGIILYTSKKGGNVPQQIMNKSLPAGIDLIMQRDRELLTQQSNVQAALQGAAPTAGTSAKRYLAEQNASATGVADYVASFNNFRLRIARKQIWVMQCFYDSHRSVQITGEDLWGYFDEDKMGDVDFDLTLVLDNNSAVVREDMKELAYQAYQKDEIAFVQMLDAADFGDTARLKRLAAEHRQEKMALAQQQAQMGMAPTGEAPGMAQRDNGSARLTDADTTAERPVVGTPGTSA